MTDMYAALSAKHDIICNELKLAREDVRLSKIRMHCSQATVSTASSFLSKVEDILRPLGEEDRAQYLVGRKARAVMEYLRAAQQQLNIANTTST